MDHFVLRSEFQPLGAVKIVKPWAGAGWMLLEAAADGTHQVSLSR